MKAVIQRVLEASVSVDGKIVGKINQGMVILIGFSHEDSLKDILPMVDKVVNLRIFEDNQGKMNRSLLEIGGDILLISQFTLLGDTRKGRRPNFMEAAPPEKAQELYQRLIRELRERNIKVETGRFHAYMQVSLINDGPVTLIVGR